MNRSVRRTPIFGPNKCLRDAVACLAVAIVVLVLVLWNYPRLEAGVPAASQLGAELGAPANPAESYGAARPEVYFLFLFQTLKYLEEFPPIVGAIVVPGLVMLSLFLMPFIGRWKLGHRFNIVWTFALLVGAGVLTCLAWYDDHYSGTPESQHYLAAVANAKIEAERAVELANSPTGIPPTGALALLQSDPKTQGPKLFRQHCASCHSHAPDKRRAARRSSQAIVAEKPSASNCGDSARAIGFAEFSIAKQIAGPHYFGNTAFKEGDMVTWVKDNIAKNAQRAERRRAGQVSEARSTTSRSRSQPKPAESVGIGRRPRQATSPPAARSSSKSSPASTATSFADEGEVGNAPDLTGYASREWLTAFLSNPADKRFYGDKNDRMPAFALHPNDPTANRISPQELAVLVSWLRGEWYEPAAAINPPAAAAQIDSHFGPQLASPNLSESLQFRAPCADVKSVTANSDAALLAASHASQQRRINHVVQHLPTRYARRGECNQRANRLLALPTADAKAKLGLHDANLRRRPRARRAGSGSGQLASRCGITISHRRLGRTPTRSHSRPRTPPAKSDHCQFAESNCRRSAAIRSAARFVRPNRNTRRRRRLPRTRPQSFPIDLAPKA